MNLFTKIPFNKYPVEIKYLDSIVLIGSCFSDVLGQKLKRLKFNVLANPFGTVYNPYSISKLIQNSFKNPSEILHIFENNGVYCHPDFHSTFCDTSIASCHQKIENAFFLCRQWMEKENSILFITLGTSFVYKWKENGEIVANCHKLSSNLFDKYILSTEESFNYLATAIDKIRSINPIIPIVLTVSPVRHTRDGIIENVRSKARLVECAHLLIERFENLFYFPSFELMNDELRDYRFYEKDLIHPNEIAHEIIWDRFCTSFFDSKTKAMIQEIEAIVMASEHKPFRPDTEGYLEFCKKYIYKINIINEQHPYLDFRYEKNVFDNKMPST